MDNTMGNSIQDHQNLTRGYVIAIISAALLSTTAIFIRHLTQTYHMPALVLAFWRDVIVVLTLLPFLARRPALLQVSHRDMIYFVGYGFVLASLNALWTHSVALNGAAISTVLIYSSAGFTVLLGWWLLQERVDWPKLLAVALSLGGCILVSEALDAAAWHTNLAGILTGILSGLAYAAYSLMGRSASQRGLNAWTSLLYTFGFATLFLLIINLVLGGFLPGTATRPADLLWLGDAWLAWGMLFMLAAGPTLAGFGLYNVSLGYLPSSVANLVLTSEPVFTTALAYLLFGERLSGVQFIGSLMVLAGVTFLGVHEGRLARRTRSRTSKAEA
jgi:drug/metabolite transporter (DMT)-like permease